MTGGTSGIKSPLVAVDVSSGNIAASKVFGGKNVETIFSANVADRSNPVPYVGSKTRLTITQAGKIESTGIETDIAIKGDAMMVVKSNPNDPNGEYRFIKGGSFREDEQGLFGTIEGNKMMAHLLDEQGNPPPDNSLLNSLQAVSFKGIKSAPKATNTIGLSMNLNSKEKTIKGAGDVLRLIGANAAKSRTAIIVPDDTQRGSLKYGDRLRLQINSDPNKLYDFILGGSVASKDAAIDRIYGSTTTSTPFTFNNPVIGSAQLADGDSLTVNVGGVVTVFTAKTGGVNPSNNEFNSLESLRALLNKLGNVVAEIKSNRLYIAPSDANQGITFTDSINGGFISELGLSDIPAYIPNLNNNTRRFYSLETLKQQINSSNNDLNATFVGNNLDFSASVALNTLNVSAISGPRVVDRPAQLGNGTVAGRSSIVMTSAAHGLRTGDYIRVTGLGGAYTDGHYMVMQTPNPNQFTIGVFDGVVGAGGAAVDLGTASWEKIPSETFAQDSIPNGSQLDYTATQNNFLIDVGVPLQGSYAANDIVYLSGLGGICSIPDGYFRITGSVGGVLAFSGTPPYVFDPITTQLNSPMNDLKIQKIGVSLGPIPGLNFNTNLFTTGVVGSNNVIMHVRGGHQYKVGDKFNFTNQTNDPIIIDGISIAANRSYIITAVTANSITFEGSSGVATVGNTSYGYNASGGINAPTSGAEINLSLNFNQRLYDYLGLDSDKAVGNVIPYTPTYDPNNPLLSLSSAKYDRSKNPQVMQRSITVHDSLGTEHELDIIFAKLDNQRWAVEVRARYDETNGTYEALGVADKNGQLLTGELLFDQNGKLIQVTGIDQAIQINWNNGSAPSSITIDWDGALSKGKSNLSGIRQVDAQFDVDGIDDNGAAAGNVESIQIDAEGFITATFSNGTVRKIFRIPIVTFTNMNGLTPADGNTYKVSRLSGPSNLRSAGYGGAATIISGALESSNVDRMQELIKLNDYQALIQANARAIGIQQKNDDIILSETRR